jgi:hypothetical protein
MSGDFNSELGGDLDDVGLRLARRDLAGRRVMLGVLAATVVASMFGAFGVRTATSRDSNAPIDADFVYASTSRAGLPISWHLHVEGLDAGTDVTVSLDQRLVGLVDINAIVPDPDEMATPAGRLLLTWRSLDPGAFDVFIDGRFQPNARGVLSDRVVVQVGTEVLTLPYRTVLVP